ncbi:hypothetical protein, partial [Haloferula sp. A504]|uniref:hypothetical protein n=1 Tax=Haloferula sp. A504 TaxID=3373601 RepID=UPI0031C9B304|nr:hypothetical protein [Verrucomicrobiaceae bacterium E54]
SPRLEPDTAPPFQPSNHPEGAWLAPVAAIGSGQERMLRTRIAFGVAAAITTYVPLLALRKLAMDYHFEFFTQYAEYSHPSLTELAIPFAPLDWWGMLPPIGIGIAVGASMRLPRSFVICCCVLGAAVLQAGAFLAAFLPYAKLTAVPGVPVYVEYPVAQLVGNIVIVSLSFGWALMAVFKLRAEKQAEAQQAGDGDA